MIEKQGYGHVLLSVGELGGIVPYTSFSARSSYIEKNKEINPDQINSEEEIWLIATLADCCYALGREDADKYEKLFLSKANEFMQSTYFEQKAKLQNLMNI